MMEKRWTLEVDVEGQPAVTKTFSDANLNEKALVRMVKDAGGELSEQHAKALLSTDGGQVPGIRIYPAE